VVDWTAMRSISDVIRSGVDLDPSSPAVTCGSEQYSYAQLNTRLHALAAALTESLGLERGDRVAVLSANCHRYLELYLTVPSTGLVLVPVNVRLATPEIHYILRDSGTRVLFTDRAIPGIDDLDLTVVMIPDEYEALLGGAGETTFWPETSPDDLAGIFYTGGTTGLAKGVMLTHANLLANASSLSSCWPFDIKTTWLLAAPMFHTAGTIGALATVANGGRHVVLPAFDPGVLLDLVERERVTSTVAVPATLKSLAEEQEARPRDVSSLVYVCHGSSPASSPLLEHFHSTFPSARLLDVYGATECSPIVTLLPDEQLLIGHPRLASSGRAAPNVGVRIAQIEQADGVGEVLVSGKNVAKGYWNKPDETSSAFRDGWYWSGDVGYLDGDGYLFLVDRSKDMIVSGSENVYSAEVEAAIATHPAVVEVAVIGIPHERWGEAVHAIVCVDGDVTADELIDHCRQHVAGFKVPKSIEIRSEPLPRSGVGKVLKRELREPYWAGHERRIS